MHVSSQQPWPLVSGSYTGDVYINGEKVAGDSKVVDASASFSPMDWTIKVSDFTAGMSVVIRKCRHPERKRYGFSSD